MPDISTEVSEAVMRRAALAVALVAGTGIGAGVYGAGVLVSPMPSSDYPLALSGIGVEQPGATPKQPSGPEVPAAPRTSPVNVVTVTHLTVQVTPPPAVAPVKKHHDRGLAQQIRQQPAEKDSQMHPQGAQRRQRIFAAGPGRHRVDRHHRGDRSDVPLPTPGGSAADASGTF